MKLSVAIILYFTLILTTLSAQSYIQNRSLFPLGEREASMANSGAALSGSSGAPYFNPAGLAAIQDTRFSISGNSYFQYTKEYSPLVETDNSSLNFKSTQLQAIPSTVVSTTKWNDAVYAVSILIPEQFKSGDIVNFETPNYNIQVTNQSQSELLMVGLSRGMKINEKLDAGVGCFWSQYTSTQSTAVVADPKAGSGVTVTGISTNYITMDVKGVLCNVGFQIQKSSEYRWGVSLNLPMYRLSGEGHRYQFTQSASGKQNTGVQKQSTRYEIPMEMRAGLLWNPKAAIQILADLTFQSAVRFKPLEDYDSEIKSEEVWRYHLGMIYSSNDRNHFLAGYAYNPSSIKLSAVGDEKEDFQVFTLGYELLDKSLSRSISLFRGNSTGQMRLDQDKTGGLKSEMTGIFISARFSY